MFAQVTTFTMLHSWLSIHHCPHTFKIHVVSKSGDNIGLVWRIMYMSEQCQFEVCNHHPLYYCITYTLSCLLSTNFLKNLLLLFVLFKQHFIARSVPHPVICRTVVLEVCKSLNRLSPYISTLTACESKASANQQNVMYIGLFSGYFCDELCAVVGEPSTPVLSHLILMNVISNSDSSCRLIQHEMFLMWACEVIIVRYG